MLNAKAWGLCPCLLSGITCCHLESTFSYNALFIVIARHFSGVAKRSFFSNP
ncbi:hypothetical protein NYG90_03320 [Helicobacter sp. XJK30-2]|uniref:Uncharacterized protein n=1 Tax=Helicobacter zhangjianzhongii TaxID=2974574 RepID=A0ACC6FRC9_9HELI|nr:hypothetical protein [Helicobacter sp. XJK30-2]MDL0081715.1 hypothetical protein [Helicobacter sp. XJK30-2]